MANTRQFLLLLWKNYLLQKRKILLTVLEILLPTLFALLLVLIRQRVIANPKPHGQNWTEFIVNDLPFELRQQFHVVPRVAFTPNNTAVRTVMESVGKTLHVNVSNNGFSNEESMVNFIMIQNATMDNFPKYLAGVVFLNDFLDDAMFPEKILYKLRLSSSPKNSSVQKFSLDPFKSTTNWFTQFMFPMFQRVGPRDNGSDTGETPGYFREGFLALQHSINQAVTQYIATSSDNKTRSTVDLFMRRHPYPPFNDDPFVLVIQEQLPFVLMLSFVLCVLNIVKDLVHERERKLKESMKMMGLNNWLHWLAWFAKYFLFLLITVGVMTLFICVSLTSKGSVIGKTDSSIVFIFLLVYAISSIAFAFAISVFFSRANSAAAAGGILFFLSYIPYAFIQPRYDTMSWWLKVVVSLISNVGMAMGSQVIGMFEGTGEGVQWSNIAHGVSVDDDFALLHVIIVLLLDTVIYLLITWYVEAVFPGEFGMPQPWYFPLLKSYWCGSIPEELHIHEDEQEPLLRKSHHNLEFFEKDPSGLRTGIQIQGLRKEFGTNVAVENLSMNMYEGQITVLLGHNGAGKTTTMSMLTGFFPPTSGTAVVNGYNLRKDIAGVRSSLGLCPQHDVLFDELTVYEHLKFFALLKGYPSWKLSAEITQILEAIGLEDKKDARAKTLSGGMKRKLSVGIALIGDSKIVILDEPSSGMDPNARRHIWGVLQKFRVGRTLLLTTHFMDEADVLGDRIAIMANGVVQCCGSSLFLKKKYGAGYHMVMVKDIDCDVRQVTDLVQSYVPQAILESSVGMELSYILPQESSSQFEALFSKVEGHKQELGISSYGASVTTMEEVFLRVGESLAVKQTDSGSVNYQSNSAEIDPHLASLIPINTAIEFNVDVQRNSDSRVYLYLQQFSAMFIKRVLHTWRNKLVTLSQLFVPLFFTILALIVIKTFPGPHDSPPLDLTPEKFPEDTVVFSLARWSDSASEDLSHQYKEQLKDSSSKVVFVNNQTGYRTDPDLMNYLFARGCEGLASYNRQFMVAASIENTSTNTVKATAFFNNQAYHTPGMTLAVLSNASLKYLTNSSYSLMTINHPLPRTLNDKAQDEFTRETTGFTLSVDLVFGMAFLASSFVLFLIKERSTKAKHIQFVSGVHSVNFWVSTFCWDMINFMIPATLLIATFAAFDTTALVEDGHWLHILLLLFLYGWAMLPFMYLLSFIFTVPSSGFVWLSMFNILSGIATILAVGILSIPQLGLEDLSAVLKWVFLLLLPNFNLGQGIIDYYSNYQGNSICGSIPAQELKQICKFVATPCCKDHCTEFCFHYQENYLAWEADGIGRQLVFLFIQGVVFFSLVLMIESEVLITLWYTLRPRAALVFVGDAEVVREDEDVARERARIANTLRESMTDSLILQELTKTYSSHVAVDQISLGVPQGECFGLLGVNGAGKTTTFKMLTGDVTVTSGTAYVDGSDVQTNIKVVQQKLGYCPQFDALIDQLTGRETLTMYARLRGVLERQIPHAVDALIRSLLLDEHADKLVQHYSGGNKRKLSTAIALVGDPPIVFLDEPTTGMDPVARRLLWDTLTRVRDSGRTLILTSHSMEECEALCTRLAIMVNGQFKCLGSPQHLKAKFGEGYTLIVKLAYPAGELEPDMGPVMGFIEQTFPGSVLKDLHEGMAHYHVQTTSMSWAEIFGTLERAKSRFSIEDYSVSQTSLELVFINLARSQVPPSELEQGCCKSCQLLCCNSKS